MSRARNAAAAFQPDEARADDHGASRAFRNLYDGAAIRHRPQRMNIRLLRAGIVRRTGSAPVASNRRL